MNQDEKRKQRQKEYYKKNRDRLLKKQKEYYIKNKEKIKAYEEENKEKRLEYRKKHYEKNKTYYKEYRRKRYLNKIKKKRSDGIEWKRDFEYFKDGLRPLLLEPIKEN